ncbi:galactoside 2-alpha-L-fucosyltransferase Sec1-like [Babylonia areolata]|uniref:galactoside 2-alpha-L-fucosyltransferase Sec1-like n=1 Tax=Babylonia areolata TaxID=304850 RepID=UPI003FCF5CDD
MRTPSRKQLLLLLLTCGLGYLVKHLQIRILRRYVCRRHETQQQHKNLTDTWMSDRSSESARILRGTETGLEQMFTFPNRTSGDETSPAKKLLCVWSAARLGNQLFEYASALGIALSLNRTAVFFGGQLERVLKNFKKAYVPGLTASQVVKRCVQGRRLKETTCCTFSENLTRLDPGYDYRVGTYLQSYRYFDKYQPVIREALTFNDDIRLRADAIVKGLRRVHSSSTLVGLHVRRGDIARGWLQERGYPVASPEYLSRSLAYFTRRYTNCVFVVASDDLEWCEQNFPEGYNVRFLVDNEPAVDMSVLISTDHVIITSGTFSWWIGYLNPGTTVYMKDFIKPNTNFARLFRPDGEDYVYPGWIPL